tara:strand:+ start:1888 stop:2544 length:657 start_codon:yes stop_codon:yes gene_type:complete
MHKNIKNLLEIKDKVKHKLNNNSKLPNIIAVSKTFEMSEIMPLLEFGHSDFGENKVQEAEKKWTNIKSSFKNLKLHMIGNLQTNKVKNVIPLFDYIHSLDSIKLAKKISEEQKKMNKNLKIFIQINIGNEPQKNGINPNDLNEFYDLCKNKFDLNIIGLMCIPPQNNQVKQFFLKMKELNNLLGLKELSMGMSADYLDAIEFDSSYIRIGSKIFGDRN